MDYIVSNMSRQDVYVDYLLATVASSPKKDNNVRDSTNELFSSYRTY